MISVFTPLHAPGNKYIAETYSSLKAQTLEDWEWIIVENNGGKVPDEIKQDARVRVLNSYATTIGALKRFACESATGDIFVELDADDLITPNALELISEAFAKGRKFNPQADFVYSDFAEFKDGSWAPNIYSPQYGWQIKPAVYRDSTGTDRTVMAMNAPEATAHNIRLVDWAPNHVRAWRKEAYWKVGGHNASMTVGDDHDLIVRMYLAGLVFKHIPECLYLYRVHGQNTVATKNADIRDTTMSIYNKNIWKIAEKWTQDKGLMLLDLCGGIDTPPGYTPIDKSITKEPGGIICDLESTWKLEDSSVGLIRANDAVEHLQDPIHMMNEAYRVLAPGGFFMILVPSTNGLGAFCDPTHKSFWNKLSFRYYTDPQFSRYIPEFNGRFQLSRCIEWFPTEWHKENNVPYVEAHLFCCKDGFRAMGEYMWEQRRSMLITAPPNLTAVSK